MKKLIIVSVIAAFFAACSSGSNSESATKAVALDHWVDSIKGIVSTSTSFDSATWAGWAADYDAVLSGINESELDENGKATLENAKTKWSETGVTYTAGLTKAKEDAAAQTAMQATDSTKMDPAMEAAKVEGAKKEEVKK